MQRRMKALVGAGLAITAASSAVAAAELVGATPGSGATGTIVARGTTPDDVKISQKGPNDIVFQRVTLDPGGYTGWHSHPGPLLVVVESGTLTHYDAECHIDTYRAGDAFIETPGTKYVHMGANHGTDQVVLDVTYTVPSGGPLRNDAPAPACGAGL